jgi:hypothetical protein
LKPPLSANRSKLLVSQVENGDRRLDVVEFAQIARLIGADPYRLLKAMEKA